MKKIVKYLYKKILYGYKASSKDYIKHLRKKGVTIGENVTFYDPKTNYVDDQKGFLIDIGNNVEITRGVTIITHDYSWSLFKHKTGEIIGSRKKIKIGNNVFIGLNTTILKGVTIGNNVVIGANSLVSKDIPDNSVACGNPAKVIGSVDELYKKRKESYEAEAIEMLNEYVKKYNKLPEEDIFDEFFWIFEKRDFNNIPLVFKEKMKLTGNFEKTKQEFENSKPIYKDFNDFIEKKLEENQNDTGK